MSKKIFFKKNISIGGDSKIAIQSMTNTQTLDYDATLEQVKNLITAGADIVRIAVSSLKEAQIVGNIARQTRIPIVADIQYNHDLAIASVENGVDKIRINPGNIGSEKAIKKVVDACKVHKVPIRIGINGGSIEKKYATTYANKEKALVESAFDSVKLLEKFGFFDIIVSIKSSNVQTMINSNRLLAKEIDYPLHIGVTESGHGEIAFAKSAIAIGTLLLENIGDTIRVSLTDDPKKEIESAKNILKSINKFDNFCEIISCPTCSRCKVDLLRYVKEAETAFFDIKKNIKVAIMGCPVNGIGEAKEADFGVAFSETKATIFAKGKVIEVINNDEALNKLIELVREKY